MKRLTSIAIVAGLAVVALAAAGWSAMGHGEFETEQGDAYFDIHADSRPGSTAAQGGARMVIKDEDEHPVLGVELPRGTGQFDPVRHNVMLQGPGSVRDAQGVHRGNIQVQVHDGGPNGIDHVRVTAGPTTWEGDLEGDIVVAPPRR